LQSVTDLFVYGSLRYEPLLAMVLGRSVGELDLQSAKLAEHGVFAVVEECFPMIEARSGHHAPGLLIKGLTKADLDALNFYEGGFDYELKPVTVTSDNGADALAMVYFPEPGLWAPGNPWSLEDWIETWGAMSLRAAEEIMAYQGRVSAREMTNRIQSIRIRAAAWVEAQQRPPDPERDLQRDVVVHNHSRSHLNFFGMEEMDLQFRRYDGNLSPVLNRSATLVGQAVVVLPYDPVRDTVLLIEQFRAATFIAGNKTPWMWEPVAGLVDPGESAVEAAHRETMEEAGTTLRALEPVAQVYSSSGSSGEFLNIFIGVSDLGQVSGGGGLDNEGEDIRSQIIGFDTLMKAVDEQVYQDMPLVTAALWLARHRHRLRQSAGV
jgi:ADP-ribose diphosphatase